MKPNHRAFSSTRPIRICDCEIDGTNHFMCKTAVHARKLRFLFRSRKVDHDTCFLSRNEALNNLKIKNMLTESWPTSKKIRNALRFLTL